MTSSIALDIVALKQGFSLYRKLSIMVMQAAQQALYIYYLYLKMQG